MYNYDLLFQATVLFYHEIRKSSHYTTLTSVTWLLKNYCQIIFI